MKKIFTLIAGVMLAASASATTPYKCLYVYAEAVPAGAGVVYMTAKNDEDSGYVSEISDDMDATAWIKIVGAENGGGDQIHSGGCTDGVGMYEVKFFAEAESGYEFVCLANTTLEGNAVYDPSVCYATHTGTGVENFQFGFNYTEEALQDGVLININNPAHPEDGDSDTNNDTPSRDELLSSPVYPDTPDTYVYAIFRKVGDEYPKFVTEETGVSRVIMSADENAPVYTVAGVRANESTKGLLIQNGKKVLVK